MLRIWTLTVNHDNFLSTMMESLPPFPHPSFSHPIPLPSPSHPPLLPHLLPPPVISQASPITGFTLRPATTGGRPVRLRTMVPWGPQGPRCCTASTPRPPAVPPSSTYTARISLRAQVCMCASLTSWTLSLIPFLHVDDLCFFYFFFSLRKRDEVSAPAPPSPLNFAPAQSLACLSSSSFFPLCF